MTRSLLIEFEDPILCQKRKDTIPVSDSSTSYRHTTMLLITMKHFHCISVYGQEDCINGLKPPLTIKQQLQVSEQMSKAQAYCGYKNIFFLKFCVNRDFLDLGEKFLNTPEFIKYLPSEVGNFFFK